jgi:hypothetical protein
MLNHDNTNGKNVHVGKNGSAPKAAILTLFEEAGIPLKTTNNGKYQAGHPHAHDSKSGTCIFIEPDKDCWRCTSCKAGGNSADFLLDIGTFEERDAAEEYLTQRFGKEYAQAHLQSKGRGSQSTQLVKLTQQAGAQLWHDPEDNSWASIPVGGHHEHWPIRSRGFRKWLGRLFYLEEQKAPSSQAITDALGVLEGQGLYDGAKYDVFTRVASYNGRYYLDMADDSWRAIEIAPRGWEIITNPPVKFRRAKGMLPLPAPTPGGSLEPFRDMLNLGDDDDWALLISWLITAFRPTGRIHY